MKSFFKHAVAVAVASLSFGAQAVLIDDFSKSQTTAFDFTKNDGGMWTSTVGADASIIGGHRDMFIIKTDGSSSPADPIIGISSMSAVGGPAGKMSFSSTDDSKAIGIVRWDGATLGSGGTVGLGTSDLDVAQAIGSINATGLGAQNLAASGLAFKITVTTADLNFPFTLLAYTDAANYSAVTLYSTGVGDYIIPFAGFVPIAGAGASFNSIGALQAIINFDPTVVGNGTVQSVDFSIDIVQTNLPEPATMGLVGAALLGIGAIRRRRAAK